MAASDIERLAKPEARETTAFDPAELQGLVAQMTDDDLALPVEPPVLASGSNAEARLVVTDGAPDRAAPDHAAHGHATPLPRAAMRALTRPGTSPSLAPREPTPPGIARYPRGSQKTPTLDGLQTQPERSLVPWLAIALVVAVGLAVLLWLR